MLNIDCQVRNPIELHMTLTKPTSSTPNSRLLLIRTHKVSVVKISLCPCKYIKMRKDEI